VKFSKLQRTFLGFALASLVLIAACHKKPAPVPPTPPTPPPMPTASLSANPATITKGQSTTLTWETSNATDVRIDPIGPVKSSGSQQVTPTDSTNYRLIAKGPGGSQESTARVTVTQPEVTAPPQQRNLTLEEEFARNVKDIYFDYDKYDVAQTQQSAVQATAAFLKQHPDVKVTVEGHCDERGSTEYNLALGDNRASAAKNALVGAGVPAAQLNPISFGKEKPFCMESNEQCWQQNRRAHFVIAK
jgi:peptidoglycan-associated lipoprotein